MYFGNIKQKASPLLVSFVFGCTFIVTILLYVVQHGEARGESLSSADMYYELTFESPLKKSK